MDRLHDSGRWFERARFLFSLPVHWSGFKVKRPPSTSGKRFKKSQWKLQCIESIEAPRNILQNSVKKCFVKSVTFIEIKDKKDWTTSRYNLSLRKLFWNVRLNVAGLSIFQKIYLRTDKGALNGRQNQSIER